MKRVTFAANSRPKLVSDVTGFRLVMTAVSDPPELAQQYLDRLAAIYQEAMTRALRETLLHGDAAQCWQPSEAADGPRLLGGIVTLKNRV